MAQIGGAVDWSQLGDLGDTIVRNRERNRQEHLRENVMRSQMASCMARQGYIGQT